jgi:hypothetical protein
MPTKIHAHIDQVVSTTGDQSNISGIKDFASRPRVNGTGVLLIGEVSSTNGIQLPNTIVYTTGNQNISGVKTFLDPLQIGTGNISFFVSDNGNVGVNTSDPKAKLHVSGGSVIFENESADPVLRLTQRTTGNGHVFLVEDSNNPDTTPFYIDKDGNINCIKNDTALRLYSPSGAHNRIGIDFGASGDSSGFKRLWGVIQDPSANYDQNLTIKRLNAPGEPSVFELRQSGNHTLYDNWNFLNRPTVNNTGIALVGESESLPVYYKTAILTSPNEEVSLTSTLQNFNGPDIGRNAIVEVNHSPASLAFASAVIALPRDILSGGTARFGDRIEIRTQINGMVSFNIRNYNSTTVDNWDYYDFTNQYESRVYRLLYNGSDLRWKKEVPVRDSNAASLINGKIPSSQLPSYVDDVIEYPNYSTLTGVSGEAGKIYVTTGDAKTYRWGGSSYFQINPAEINSQDLVYITGNQTINGIKTFNNRIIVGNNRVALSPVYTGANLGSGDVFQIQNKDTYANIFMNVEGHSFLVLPETNLEKGSFVEVTLTSDFSNDLYRELRVYPTFAAYDVEQGLLTTLYFNQSARFIYGERFENQWLIEPVTRHADSHFVGGNDPIYPKDINAVSIGSNYYTDNLILNISWSSGAGIYKIIGTRNGRPLYSKDGLSNTTQIGWNSTSSRWEIGLSSFQTLFFRSSSDVATPDLATGWVSVLGGYTFNSLVKQANINITPNDINALSKSGDQDITGVLTSSLPNSDVRVPLGFSTVAYVRNNGANLTKGETVYIAGAQGDRATVKKANNLSEGTSARTFGLAAQSIASGADGYILTNGQLQNLSILTGFDTGDMVWLGSGDGTLTKTKPQAPQHAVFLGVVERPSNGNNGIMYVKVQNGYEIDELHDVKIVNPQSGQILVFENNLWTNKNVESVTYITNNITNISTAMALAL